ncbi:MAG: aldehyde dehydrogenase family protein, partial [Janthinobacterium sp.]
IYPFSNQADTVQLLIDTVMSGGVSVNDALYHVGQHDLPFGGVGESGMGHYHGVEGFHTFSKLRPVFYQARYLQPLGTAATAVRQAGQPRPCLPDPLITGTARRRWPT